MTNREGRSAAQSQTSFQILKWPFLLPLQRETVKPGRELKLQKNWEALAQPIRIKHEQRYYGENRWHKQDQDWGKVRPCFENHGKCENQFTLTQTKILLIQFLYMCIMSTFSVSPACAYASFIYNFPRFRSRSNKHSHASGKLRSINIELSHASRIGKWSGLIETGLITAWQVCGSGRAANNSLAHTRRWVHESTHSPDTEKVVLL